MQQIRQGNLKKGDPFTVARLAGIMGAKKTSDLIPLCHNIILENIDIAAKAYDIFAHASQYFSIHFLAS